MKEHSGATAFDYTLYAQNGGGQKPNVGYTKTTQEEVILPGVSSLVVNGWTHLAGLSTAQVASLRNGVQVASKKRRRPSRPRARVAYWRRFGVVRRAIEGLIDEVRIYNRALTAAEIQLDMNSPVVATADAGSATDAAQEAEAAIVDAKADTQDATSDVADAPRESEAAVADAKADTRDATSDVADARAMPHRMQWRTPAWTRGATPALMSRSMPSATPKPTWLKLRLPRRPSTAARPSIQSRRPPTSATGRSERAAVFADGFHRAQHRHQHRSRC